MAWALLLNPCAAWIPGAHLLMTVLFCALDVLTFGEYVFFQFFPFFSWNMSYPCFMHVSSTVLPQPTRPWRAFTTTQLLGKTDVFRCWRWFLETMIAWAKIWTCRCRLFSLNVSGTTNRSRWVKPCPLGNETKQQLLPVIGRRFVCLVPNLSQFMGPLFDHNLWCYQVL